eukprot:TRINITY_DN27597_c0_g1_i1.p1 TRINITY_DN27597_c0_g1~~TRINITY_DN27597_c0_g1_i1.p1  ORF type:complete len:184 (+),score=44.08 TRINITY_DN27597_c0_g1_i1:71-622(+)
MCIRDRGRGVLELGSGVGLTGVCVQRLSPSVLRLTDYAEEGSGEEVLRNLQHNVDLNHSHTHGEVHVSALDWMSVSDEHLSVLAQQCDLVLAADVLYSPQLVPALTRVLSGLISAADHPVEVLLAASLRGSTLWDGAECLVNAMLERDPALSIQKVAPEVHPVFGQSAYERSSVQLYRIRGAD